MNNIYKNSCKENCVSYSNIMKEILIKNKNGFIDSYQQSTFA